MVGECRGAEVVLLTARILVTAVLERPCTPIAHRRCPCVCVPWVLAGLDDRTVALHTATAFERIIHLEHRDGRRRIEGVYSPHPQPRGAKSICRSGVFCGSEVGY